MPNEIIINRTNQVNVVEMSLNYGPPRQVITPISATSIVTNGLTYHVDAGNTDSYPGSGTVWTDLSGNNYATTLWNSPTYSTDGGGSIVFNGTTQYATTNTSLADITADWTMNIWYKTAGSINVGSLLVRGNLAETYQWRCELDASTGKVRFVMRNPSDQSVLGTTSTNNAGWKMATYVKSGTTVTVYLNAVSENSNTITNLSSATNIVAHAVIGRLGNSVGPYYYNGSIAIIQAYNRALSLSEIQQNFDARRSRYGL